MSSVVVFLCVLHNIGLVCPHMSFGLTFLLDICLQYIIWHSGSQLVSHKYSSTINR